MKKETVRTIDYEELKNLSAIGGNDDTPGIAPAKIGTPTGGFCSAVATATVITITVTTLLSRGTCRND